MRCRKTDLLECRQINMTICDYKEGVKLELKTSYHLTGNGQLGCK
jgi:hypothetical protein